MSVKSLANNRFPANTPETRPVRTGSPQKEDFVSSLERVLSEKRETGLSRPALEAKLLALSMTRSVLADDSGVQDYFPSLKMSLGSGIPEVVRQSFSCHNYGSAIRPFDPPSSLSEAPSLDEIIERAAGNHGVDRKLIRAVIRTESNFDPEATSPAGAQGLMQLMPETARELGVTDPFDPEQNVMAGTRYLRQLLDRYEGDLERALAAYNWGMGNLERKGMEKMPRETRDYLARVIKAKDLA